ncbi:MAG TPA: SIR2 family protein [Pyrinomonadaceae bacterium]|jgi:hypothetical protein
MELDNLAKQIALGDCTIFVGAGLSLSAKLPNWPDLLRRMLTWSLKNGVVISKAELTELKAHINNNDLLLVAEEMSERLTPEKYQRFMHEVFTENRPRPADVHKLITQIPFSSALTSNYDTLLETAYQTSLNTSINVYTHKDVYDLLGAYRRKEFFIFKVHGDIQRISTIVLGRSDYRNLMYTNVQYRRMLEMLFSTRTVLFIGFGLTDPDLLLLLEELRETFQGYSGMHYALMDTRSCSSIMHKRFVKDYGISIIPYTSSSSSHPEIRTFLKKLGGLVRSMKNKLREDEEARTKKTFDALINKEGSKYELRAVRREEIPALREFCVKLLGNEISSVEKMIEWHDKNPDIFNILLQARAVSTESLKDIVGYYCIIPLNEEAAKLIHNENITGAMFSIDHIVPKGKKPAAIYIGGIAAEKQGKARAYIIGSIVQQLSKIRSRGIPIYSRPITDEGLNLLHGYSFVPVNYASSSLNHVHKLSSLKKLD